MNYKRLTETKRAVIKVGTSSLTYETGKLNIKKIESIVRVVSDLRNRGIEVVLVSSGAVGAGVGKLNLPEKPSETIKKQALAAIGQATLVSMYDRFFSEYGHSSAQVLLTKFILDDEERYRNTKNTFETMFEYGVIPIVNENDVISTYELEFGDNDTLSAYIAKLVDAGLLIILSDIDGLYDSNPQVNPEARLVEVVEKIDESVYAIAGGAGSRRGTGGMVTKLKAAEIVNPEGIDMIISNGAYPERIYDIFEGKSVGTLFVGSK
ncbi:MAG: glutamate 5-kinase [Ruminococcaceae bacterium]|nr:glutamate 5-kinase [Oscillospiraceae bacterium]